MALPVEKKLGLHVFVIGHIPAMKAPRALKQLASIAGPFLSELSSLLGSAGSMEMSDAATGGKLDGIVKQAMAVDDAALLDLMLEMASATTVIGQPNTLRQNFDAVFTGNLDNMALWFVESIKVNFGSFSKLGESLRG